jgi:hypothetical protein
MYMIKNREEANKYYKIVNDYIDGYVETHKIRPSKLKKYLGKSQRLIKFLERAGLKDISNIKRVIDDVIDDRVAIERDTIKTFESFSEGILEGNSTNLSDYIYTGIEPSSINHEKWLSNHFDVSLGHIDVIDSKKHIFKIEDFNSEFKVCIFSPEEIEIIEENIKDFYYEKSSNKNLKFDNLGVNVELGDLIDKEKFISSLSNKLRSSGVSKILSDILNLEKFEISEDDCFIGFWK